MPYLRICTQEFTEQAVERVVTKALLELPDYRLRDPLELRAAVRRAYNNWCESVISNDFSHSVAQSQKAIQERLAQGVDPSQIARTPWLICETVLELLLQVEEGTLDPIRHTEFIERARRLTTEMTLVGKFSIKRAR